MTRAQLALLRPMTPAVIGFGVTVLSAPLSLRLWPLTLACVTLVALDTAWEWRRLRWANELWALAARMRTVRTDRLRLHYEPQWVGLVSEWDLAGALSRELRHLEAAWFGSRLRGGADVHLPRFPEVAARVTGGASGMAWAPGRLIVLPAEPLSDVPRIARHEFTHLLIPKLGPAEPAFKTEGLCVFLQELGLGAPSDFGPWPYSPGGPVEQLPQISAMLDGRFFFDPANRGMCYGVAGWFTYSLVTAFGWPAYVRFFRRANARNYRRAFAAAFGVSLEEVEADWRAEVEAQHAEATEGTDVD